MINSIKKKITSKVLRLLQIILVPKFEQMLIQIGKQSTFLMLQNNISPKKTTDVGFKVFSQFDEDGILTFLVNKLQLDELTVFEIGAGDFSECNSRWLVENFGAKSVVVDCDPLLQRNIEIMAQPLTRKQALRHFNFHGINVVHTSDRQEALHGGKGNDAHDKQHPQSFQVTCT